MNKHTLFEFIPTTLIESYDIRMDFDTLSVPNMYIIIIIIIITIIIIIGKYSKE